MSSHGNIIDMRRPPPAPGLESLALYWDKSRIVHMGRDLGFEPAASYLAHSVDGCIAEMDEAGIATGVVTGRQSGKRLGHVANDAIVDLVKRHPTRFWGMGGVDLDDLALAKRQIEEIIRSPLLCGAVIESGCAEAPRFADDRELTPIFGACEDA